MKVNEKEIRTKDKDMLVCTAYEKEKGDYYLIKRFKKKEDEISVGEFLQEIYGKPVTILVG